MKSVLAAAAVSLFALSAAQAAPLAPASAGVTGVSSNVELVRDGRGRSRTRVITTAPAATTGVDLTTLMLLGALGGGGGAASFGLSDSGGGLGLSLLPLLLGQQNAGTTTIIEERGRRRWRGPRPAPTSRSR